MPTVVVVHDATYFYVCVLVPHRGRVAVLKPLPVRRRPRVRPTPAVHHALRFAVGQMHAIRPTHCRERANTAGKAKRKFLHFANLTLIVGNFFVIYVKCMRGVDFVNIFASGK